MKNNLTFRALDFQVQHLFQLGENDVKLGVRQTIINAKLMKLYGLLDGLNDPFYNFNTILAVAADQTFLKDATNSAGTVTSIDNTTKTIVLNAGLLTAGALVQIVTWAANGVLGTQWIARITVGGANATYAIISGNGADVNGATRCSIHVLNSLSVATGDVSTIYLKDILKISDMNGTGGKERFFNQVKDPNKFADLWRDPNYEELIGFYLRGDSVDFFTGVTAGAIGQATMQYRGKPNLYTSATQDNTILLPPEHNGMLMDECGADYLRSSSDGGRPIPADLQERLTAYKSLYEAAATDKQKALDAKRGR